MTSKVSFMVSSRPFYIPTRFWVKFDPMLEGRPEYAARLPFVHWKPLPTGSEKQGSMGVGGFLVNGKVGLEVLSDPSTWGVSNSGSGSH